MSNDQVTRKEFQLLQKQFEGLRDRHNLLEQEVHRINGNVDRAIKVLNQMVPRDQYDSNWAALMKRLEALEKRP
jgi:hypothetical protein